MADYLFDSRRTRLALRGVFLGIANRPPLVQWENRSLVPPTDSSIWIREHLLISYERPIAIGINAAEGEYRLTILFREGSGTERAEDFSRQLLSKYLPGLRVYEDGREFVEVQVPKRKRISSFDETWSQLPFVVEWLSTATLVAS